MGEEAIQYCRSYAMRAEIKMGEMLRKTERATRPPGPGRGKVGHTALPTLSGSPPTLSDLGLTKRESAEAQEKKKEAGIQGKKGGRGKKKTHRELIPQGFSKEKKRTAARRASELGWEINFLSLENPWGQHRRFFSVTYGQFSFVPYRLEVSPSPDSGKQIRVVYKKVAILPP